MKRFLLAAAAVLFTSAALAAGIWTGLPASTSPGTPSIGAPTLGGGPITGGGCIPMDTGNQAGVNPATMCVSPSQLSNFASGVALSYSSAKVDAAVPLASMGNDTTPVAGSLYYAQLNIPSAFTVTNVACLNGSVAATDKVIYALYNASGNLVGNTTTAASGTTASGVNGFQSIALTTPLAATPGLYFVAYTASGNSTRFRSITANGAGDLTGSATGTAGVVPATITVPTSFVANVGPICYVN